MLWCASKVNETAPYKHLHKNSNEQSWAKLLIATEKIIRDFSNLLIREMWLDPLIRMLTMLCYTCCVGGGNYAFILTTAGAQINIAHTEK